jgi:hypothetical protein
MTLTTWLENLALARSSGTYLKYRDKLAKPDLLILDDFGMRKLTAMEAQDLCETSWRAWCRGPVPAGRCRGGPVPCQRLAGLVPGQRLEGISGCNAQIFAARP